MPSLRSRLPLPAFALLLLSAFLPYAYVDMRAVADRESGPDAVAAYVAASMTPYVNATAWNAHVKLGTATIPVWIALVLGAAAACCWTLRSRGVLSIPRGAARVTSVLAAAMILAFGLRIVGVGSLLAGFWIAAISAVALVAAVMRDPAPTP